MKSRFNPITLKAAGQCPGCSCELSPGVLAYYDNVTKRRWCMPCGDRQARGTAPPGDTKGAAGPNNTDSLAPLYEEQKRLYDKLNAMELKLDMLITLVAKGRN